MDKRLGFGACLLGIAILHACTFSSTDSTFSRTNTINNSGQNVGQKQSNPKYSGVIFAGGEANLIPPINKQERQALLDAAINPVTNADRTPLLPSLVPLLCLPPYLPPWCLIPPHLPLLESPNLDHPPKLNPKSKLSLPFSKQRKLKLLGQWKLPENLRDRVCTW